MKNLIISLTTILVLFSCTKSSESPTPPNPPPLPDVDRLVKSLTVYEPLLHAKGVVNFGYSQNTLLASLHLHNYDSLGGNNTIDSTLLSFTQPDGVTLPGSYDLTFQPGGLSEHHLLFYDNQKRITKDSVTVNQTNNFATQYFTYDGYGNTAIQSIYFDPQTPGSSTYQQADTMYMPEDNMLSDIGYMTPGGDLIHLISRSFSTDLNPLYIPQLANNLGTIISYNSIVDFRSKNLPSQFMYQNSNFEFVNLNFVWTKDEAGRVVQGIGTDPGSGVIGQIYTFTY